MKNNGEFAQASSKNNKETGELRLVVDYLQRLFPVTPAQSDFLLPYLEIREFCKKTIVVEEGEVDNYLNMVIRGLVRKFIRKGKNEYILQFATEGHLVDSEISFITRQPSLVVLETIEPTVMVSLSYENLQLILEQMPGADRIGRLLMTDMFMKKDERHYKQLQLSTRERFLEYMNNHPHMIQRIPQKYLASYLNIKPETFSRLKHLLMGQLKSII